ncbi:uncharacterized protein LOC131943463 [Physella acuta]|uniref:uncharacterized protein LOC131943463 n=1 Tax=Physella acuta TaxID=109671 RepID=UPI0027DD83AE|nr:uncharacterized protein LOC131943463 [Physella acuta]
MAATQTFAIFGLMTLNLGCLLLALYVFVPSTRGSREAGLGAAVSLLVAAASWLIAVCVFGAYADRQKGSDPGKLGFSFGLAIVALILSLAAGVMVLVTCCKGGSVGSK